MSELRFRDPEQGQRLIRRLHELAEPHAEDPVKIMHVCGSHEQAIAKFGLRSVLPPACA